MNASPSSDSPRPPFSGVHLWVPESRVIIVSQQLSLLRGGACSQITPDSHAGEAPSWGPGTGFLCPRGWCSFPVHALVCGSQVKRMEAAQDLCTVLHRVAVSQWLAPGEAHIPAWDSTFVSLFPPVRGPNPADQASARLPSCTSTGGSRKPKDKESKILRALFLNPEPKTPYLANIWPFNQYGPMPAMSAFALFLAMFRKGARSLALHGSTRSPPRAGCRALCC